VLCLKVLCDWKSIRSPIFVHVIVSPILKLSSFDHPLIFCKMVKIGVETKVFNVFFCKLLIDDHFVSSRFISHLLKYVISSFLIIKYDEV
jgi:hypothetical protein